MSLKKYSNVYEFETVLPGVKKTVKYKGISSNMVKKMVIYKDETDPLKTEEIIDYVLNIAVINEDFNVDDLYVNDRYYLLVKILEATKGSLIETQYNCKKCKGQVLQSIDLNNLYIDKTDIKNNEIELSDGQVKLILDHPKRLRQKEIYNFVNSEDDEFTKKINMALVDLASLVTEIQTPEGNEPIKYNELIEYIGDLPETEEKKFRDWLEENKFGVTLTHNLVCPHCGDENTVEVPLNNFF